MSRFDLIHFNSKTKNYKSLSHRKNKRQNIKVHLARAKKNYVNSNTFIARYYISQQIPTLKRSPISILLCQFKIINSMIIDNTDADNF